jgi:hypothetical protein
VPGHPRPPGAEVSQGAGRAIAARPARQQDEQFDGHPHQGVACRRAQLDARGILGHLGQVLARGPPVVGQDGDHCATLEMSPLGRTFGRICLAASSRGRRHSPARLAPRRNDPDPSCPGGVGVSEPGPRARAPWAASRTAWPAVGLHPAPTILTNWSAAHELGDVVLAMGTSSRPTSIATSPEASIEGFFRDSVGPAQSAD